MEYKINYVTRNSITIDIPNEVCKLGKEFIKQWFDEGMSYSDFENNHNIHWLDFQVVIDYIERED